MKPTKVPSLLAGLIILISAASTMQGQVVTLTGPELLGRPTNNSVTLNVVANAAIEAYVQYGMQSGNYTDQTGTISSSADEPLEVVIGGLQSNTRYYYRVVYRRVGTTTWTTRDEHSFHTQRPPGSTFTFTIISDSHMNGGGGNVALYEQTLENVGKDNPDFHFDLGDTFWMDGVTTVAVANQRYLAQRQWMGAISHSAAIFVAPGNHENEEGWNFDDTPVSKALLSVNARKRYYPNPIPDDFYAGNTDNSLTAINGDHLREDYFAWEWGDALFVVIDPFQYTMTKPYSGSPGGEENDETVIGDRWDWTLGEQQYQWFKQTLENSHATFKFVFAHHVTGGTVDYVRGGANAVPYCEWGGYNVDGTTWGFDVHRSGWHSPIHQLMVENGVSAFFHGHDHEYAYEKRDGVVYQLVPAPSMTGYGFNLYHESDPYTNKVLPNSGHLRVTVFPSETTVDYVNTNTGLVTYSYTIDATPLPIQIAFFTASVVKDNNVEVTWKTVSETNNYGFEVLRKRNENAKWYKVGFVEGHGTTLAPQSYSYADAGLSFGKYYYRIKQVDLDGKSQTFPEMSVTVGVGPGRFILAQNHPNPFNPRTQIEFVVPRSGYASVKVYNLLGQEVATAFQGDIEAGQINTACFDATNLPSGIYYYTLRSTGKVDTKRMVLMK
jgi:hypothetical protein